MKSPNLTCFFLSGNMGIFKISIWDFMVSISIIFFKAEGFRLQHPDCDANSVRLFSISCPVAVALRRILNKIT